MSDTRREPARDTLIRLATDSAIKFWVGEGDAEATEFATLEDQGVRKHLSLKSREFSAWLIRRFYAETNRGPNKQALHEALATLAARALHEGARYRTWVRTGEYSSTIYLDLADERWRAVSINSGGYSIVPNPPVRFVRRHGMRTLPEPRRGGNLLELLGRFLNLRSPDDLALICGWLVVAAQPHGPFPVLVLQGEQGTAKSTTARVCRALIDPNVAPIKTTPRDERDLVLAGKSNWLLMLDNLSGLPNWLSDGLARIATGAGFSTRQLFTDTDETVIAITRPICINGIDDCVTRGDLLDRSIVINLAPIPAHLRRSEREFWNDFENALPDLLGALCDALSTAMANKGKFKYTHLPRMADAAIIAANASPSWGLSPTEWLDAYNRNRKGAVEASLDGSPIASAIRLLLADRKHWQGTSTTLLADLNSIASDRARAGRDWARDPRTLSERLHRLAPLLRQVGIEIEFFRSGGERIIRLGQIDNPASSASTTAQGDDVDAEMQM